MSGGIGTESAQTRAPRSGIVGREGGGLIPTLDSGGGALVANTSRPGSLA